MADRNLELALRIRADVKQALGEMRQFQRAEKGVRDQASRPIPDSTTRLRRGLRATATTADRTANVVRNVQAAAVALGTVLGTREILRASDTYAELRGRLRLVVESEEQLVEVEQKLFDAAQETRSSYEGTVELYARIARNAGELGLSQENLLAVTTATNQAIQISGATAQEASAGVIQFAQALASGELRGDEFRSVMESMPRLAQALADGLGVPLGELRDLSAQGQLTADVVMSALLSQTGKLSEEFGQLERTTAQAATQLTNDIQRIIAGADTGPVLDAIDDLRDTLADPNVQQGITDFAAAIVTAMGSAIKMVADLTGGIKGLAEYFAAELSGEYTGSLDQLDRRVADLTRRADDQRRKVGGIPIPGTGLAKEVERLEAEREDLLRMRKLLYEQPTISPATDSQAETKTTTSPVRMGALLPKDASAEERRAQIYEKALDQLQRNAALVGEISHRERVLWEIQHGRYQSLSEGQRQALLAAAAELDAEEAFEAQVQASARAVAEENAEYQDWLQSQRKAAQAYADMADPLAEVRRQLEEIERLQVMFPELAEQLDMAAQKIRETADEGRKEMDEFSIAAARGIQSAFADFLFDPFEDGLEGLVKGFADALRRMAAEALAAQLARKMFGDMGTTGEAGGWVGAAVNFAASLFHTGGIVGAGGGMHRSVDPSIFLGAPRYHSGGLAGLAPNEVPAILKRNEEVLTEDDPRNMLNGGGTAAGTRIVNVIDPNMVSDYLSSSSGEKVLVNVLQRNAGAIKQVLV